jgi:type I restriction enzyme S subunit
LDQLITKKRNIKQGTMQQLLTGKKRLPGFSGEWEVKKLGEIFDFKNGLNKEKKYFGVGTPIVNYMDVYKNRSLTAKDLKGKVTVTDKEIKTYEVRKDDVFFTRTSETVDEIGISSVIIEDLENTVFSGFVLRARPKNTWLITSYKKYCFSSYTIRKEITSKSSYTTRALTNGKLLSDVQILIPPTEEEQKEIAQILSDMDAEIAALEQKRDKYKAIKQGMMQELLTGKTRLL